MNFKDKQLMKRIRKDKYYSLYKMYYYILRVCPKLCRLSQIGEFDVNSILHKEREHARDKESPWNLEQLDKHPWLKFSENYVNLLIKRDCQNQLRQGPPSKYIQKRWYINEDKLAVVFRLKPQQQGTTYYIYSDKNNAPLKVMEAGIPSQFKNQRFRRTQVFFNKSYLKCLKFYLEDLQQRGKIKRSDISRYKGDNTPKHPAVNISLMLKHLFYRCCQQVSFIKYAESQIKVNWSDVIIVAEELNNKYWERRVAQNVAKYDYRQVLDQCVQKLNRLSPPVFNVNHLSKLGYDHPRYLVDGNLLKSLTRTLFKRYIGVNTYLNLDNANDTLRHYEHYQKVRIKAQVQRSDQYIKSEKDLIRRDKHDLKNYLIKRHLNYPEWMDLLFYSHW